MSAISTKSLLDDWHQLGRRPRSRTVCLAIVFKNKVIILYIVFTIIYKVSSISSAQHPTQGRGLIGRSPGCLNNYCLCNDAAQCPRSPLLGHVVMDVVNIATQRWQQGAVWTQCGRWRLATVSPAPSAGLALRKKNTDTTSLS